MYLIMNGMPTTVSLCVHTLKKKPQKEGQIQLSGQLKCYVKATLRTLRHFFM